MLKLVAQVSYAAGRSNSYMTAEEQQVARMSTATCGIDRREISPGCRFAHPGFACSSDLAAFVALVGGDRELAHMHCSPYSPRLRRPAARAPFCQQASPHRSKDPDSDPLRKSCPCTVQTQELITISML